MSAGIARMDQHFAAFSFVDRITELEPAKRARKLVVYAPKTTA